MTNGECRIVGQAKKQLEAEIYTSFRLSGGIEPAGKFSKLIADC
jgi:hypothetical protein